MELGDRYLVVQRASIGQQGGRSNAGGGLPPSGDITTTVARLAPSVLASAGSQGVPTRVLQMLNMVTAEELVDDLDYEEIMEDVKEECGRYGEVLEVRIPRPIKVCLFIHKTRVLANTVHTERRWSNG